MHGTLSMNVVSPSFVTSVQYLDPGVTFTEVLRRSLPRNLSLFFTSPTTLWKSRGRLLPFPILGLTLLLSSIQCSSHLHLGLVRKSSPSLPESSRLSSEYICNRLPTLLLDTLCVPGFDEKWWVNNGKAFPQGYNELLAKPEEVIAAGRVLPLPMPIRKVSIDKNLLEKLRGG
jgi:hypothetical protein